MAFTGLVSTVKPASESMRKMKNHLGHNLSFKRGCRKSSAVFYLDVKTHGEILKIKTKILVALAFLVAAFYAFEVTLTLINQGIVAPVFIKAGIVAAAIYYAITAIKKSKLANAQTCAE